MAFLDRIFSQLFVKVITYLQVLFKILNFLQNIINNYICLLLVSVSREISNFSKNSTNYKHCILYHIFFKFFVKLINYT